MTKNDQKPSTELRHTGLGMAFLWLQWFTWAYMGAYCANLANLVARQISTLLSSLFYSHVFFFFFAFLSLIDDFGILHLTSYAFLTALLLFTFQLSSCFRRFQSRTYGNPTLETRNLRHLLLPLRLANISTSIATILLPLPTT